VLIARWLKSVLRATQILYVDLVALNYRPVKDLFTNLRPDIAILGESLVHTWELTVCHETNFLLSKAYKVNKHIGLHENKTSMIGARSIFSHTVEVLTLGFVANTKPFTSALGSDRTFRSNYLMPLKNRCCEVLSAFTAIVISITINQNH